MPSLEARLVAGLLAQDWRETSSHSSAWRRFGKFGRGAMYVIQGEDRREAALCFSHLHITDPQIQVTGPILDQILAAGEKALTAAQLDTEGMLIELMYKGDNNG